MPRDDEEIESSENDDAPSEESTELPPPPRKNKGGRPRKNPLPSAIPAAAAPVGVGAVPAADADVEVDEGWSKDPQHVWAKVIEKTLAQGLYPDRDISISIMRQPSGPVVGEWQRLSSIPGRAVYVPDNPIASGELLMTYIQDVYHVSAAGPSKYEIAFNVTGGRNSRLMKKCQFVLADPREMIAMRSRAMAVQQSFAAPSGGFQPMMAYPSGMGPGSGLGSPPRGNPPSAGEVSPSTPQPSGQSQVDLATLHSIEQIKQQIAYQFGLMNAHQQQEAARALGMAGVPAPVAAPPAESEDARIARVVATTLRGMGIGAPPPETEDERIARVVAKALQGVGIGAAPPPPAVPPGYVPAPQYVAPPGGFSGAVAQAREQVSGLREMVKVFKELEGVKSALGLGAVESEAVTLPEAPAAPVDPSAPPFNVRPIPMTASPLTGGQPVNWVDRAKYDSSGQIMKDDAGAVVNEGLADWAMKMAVANPGLAANLMEKMTKILDQSALGSLMKRVADASGGQAAAAAAQATPGVLNGAAGMIGMGAPPRMQPPMAPPPPPDDTLP